MLGKIQTIIRWGLPCACGMVFVGVAWAQDRLSFDTPVSVSGIETACTGIAESRDDPRWPAYGLRVETAGKDGQFLGEAQVSVVKDGKTLVRVACNAPWILFKLPPARYTVNGSAEGKTASVNVYVPASGQGRAILRFPTLGGAISPQHPVSLRRLESKPVASN